MNGMPFVIVLFNGRQRLRAGREIWSSNGEKSSVNSDDASPVSVVAAGAFVFFRNGSPRTRSSVCVAPMVASVPPANSAVSGSHRQRLEGVHLAAPNAIMNTAAAGQFLAAWWIESRSPATEHYRDGGQQRQQAKDRHQPPRQPGRCLAPILMRDERQQEPAHDRDGRECARFAATKCDQPANDTGGAGGTNQRFLEGERRNHRHHERRHLAGAARRDCAQQGD